MQPFKRERLWSCEAILVCCGVWDIKLYIFILVCARRSLWRSTYPVFAPSRSWWPSHPPAPVCKTQRQERFKKKSASLTPLYAQASNPLPPPENGLSQPPSWSHSPLLGWQSPLPVPELCPLQVVLAVRLPLLQSVNLPTWWHMTFGSCTSHQCWLHSKAAHRKEIMKQT